METLPSKQNGSSEKPAEALNLGLQKAKYRVPMCHLHPKCAGCAPCLGGWGILAYPAPKTPWEQPEDDPHPTYP